MKKLHPPMGRTAMIASVVFGLCTCVPASAGTKADDTPDKPTQAATAMRDEASASESAQTSAGKPDEAQHKPQGRGANGAKLDHSGKTRVGKASFYARRFAGRKMADGERMKPTGANAASKTLPLGTVARVTNLDTEQSAQVTIQDRGPYVRGRIIDLSPSTAQQIGITPKQGVARVEVAPITVPQADGGVKPGDGAKQPS